MKKCTSFEEQERTRYIVYFGITVFSCLLSTNPCLRFLLICFAREIKGFWQSFLGNKVDFTDVMNVSPNIFANNFKKNWDTVCRWKSNDYNDIDIFLSIENPCTFLLVKENTWKIIFNPSSELSQNRTEKLCHSKQQ